MEPIKVYQSLEGRYILAIDTGKKDINPTPEGSSN